MLDCEKAYVWFKENQTDKSVIGIVVPRLESEDLTEPGSVIGEYRTLVFHIPSGLHWLLYLKLLGKIPEITVAVCKICHFLLLD